MVLECLLVSNDPEVARVLQPTLEELSIKLHVCQAAEKGEEILAAEKFDAVIVDCDDLVDGAKVLQSVRAHSSNKSSVTCAILNGRTTATQSFEMGTNFVLQKPIHPVNAMRCFSAAVGLMVRERRRYYRVPIDMPATISFVTGKKLKANATNISEGGMALGSLKRLDDEEISGVQFTLPGTSNSVETKAELAWADASGRAGIRFTTMPALSRDHLERWLTVQIAALETSVAQ
jgi:DNA-binding response OmpR family regulator